MKKNLLALAASLLAPFASIYAVEVQNLRCEFRTSPLTIEAAKPGLFWKLETGNLKLERGIKQTAYQILVASTPEILAKDQGDLWDSGKVESDQSVHVGYSGKPLASGMLCHWKIKAWTIDAEGEDENTDWSAPAFWRMGTLEAASWLGKWIGHDDADLNIAPWMRKSFDLPAVPTRAFVTVNIAGYAELYINGQKAGTDVLTPAVSDNTKQVFYNTYDVTSLLKPGRNMIGLWVG